MHVSVKNAPLGMNFWVLRAVAFYTKLLISRQLERHLKVSFEFKNVPRGICAETGAVEVIHALCSTGDEYSSRGRPRSFVIELDNDLGNPGQLEMLMSTIAHEMVHVKQYAYGELDDGQTVWKGESIDGDSLPYSEHPWEIEADRVEEILFNKLRSHDQMFQEMFLLDSISSKDEGNEQQQENSIDA
jgi:hypothetical protein